MLGAVVITYYFSSISITIGQFFWWQWTLLRVYTRGYNNHFVYFFNFCFGILTVHKEEQVKQSTFRAFWQFLQEGTYKLRNIKQWGMSPVKHIQVSVWSLQHYQFYVQFMCYFPPPILVLQYILLVLENHFGQGIIFTPVIKGL